MANNKIKFEMTLKELTFKFEGDYEQGQRLQMGVNKTLSDLGRLQSIAAGHEEPKVIEAQPVVPARTSRRRKRKLDSADGAPDNLENNTQENPKPNNSSDRRSLGVSPTQLLTSLRKEGFFSQPKSSSQIVSELNRTGHTAVKDSDLTSPLLRLCTRKILSRDKPNGSKIWMYQAGEKDE